MSDDDSADEIEDDFKLKSSNVRETVALNVTASGQGATFSLFLIFSYFGLFFCSQVCRPSVFYNL